MKIPLIHGFIYQNEPCGLNKNNGFLGRNIDLERLANKVAFSNGSAFWIAGFRGVGKTSLVLEAIRLAQRKIDQQVGRPKFTLLPVVLSLATARTSENLLFQIVNGIISELRYSGHFCRLNSKVQEIITVANLRTGMQIKGTSEESQEYSGTADIAILNQLPKLGISSKNQKKSIVEAAYLPYDMMSMEQDVIQLVRLLLDIDNYPRSWKFWQKNVPAIQPVFVFDEIDKIQSDGIESSAKHIEELLGPLKSIITTAGLHFIFIGGRDSLSVVRRDERGGNGVLRSIF